MFEVSFSVKIGRFKHNTEALKQFADRFREIVNQGVEKSFEQVGARDGRPAWAPYKVSLEQLRENARAQWAGRPAAKIEGPPRTLVETGALKQAATSFTILKAERSLVVLRTRLPVRGKSRAVYGLFHEEPCDIQERSIFLASTDKDLDLLREAAIEMVLWPQLQDRFK